VDSYKDSEFRKWEKVVDIFMALKGFNYMEIIAVSKSSGVFRRASNVVRSAVVQKIQTHEFGWEEKSWDLQSEQEDYENGMGSLTKIKDHKHPQGNEVQPEQHVERVDIAEEQPARLPRNAPQHGLIQAPAQVPAEAPGAAGDVGVVRQSWFELGRNLLLGGTSSVKRAWEDSCNQEAAAAKKKIDDQMAMQGKKDAAAAERQRENIAAADLKQAQGHAAAAELLQKRTNASLALEDKRLENKRKLAEHADALKEAKRMRRNQGAHANVVPNPNPNPDPDPDPDQDQDDDMDED
jgi:hypothetical protein